MKKILFILLLSVSAISYGQVYQRYPQYGQFPGVQADSVLTIPLGIDRLRNATNGRNVGQLRYNTTDSSMYVYTGTQWVKSSAQGGIYIASYDSTTKILSGSVIWDSNFVFHNTTIVYQILGRRFTAAASTFSISPAHPTLDRFTVVYADTLGNIGTINGSNGSPADIPNVDPASQILLAVYEIKAGSTSPYHLSNNSVYRENIEWVPGSNITSADFAYPTNPFSGAVSAYFPGFTNGQYFKFTDAATYDLNNYSYIKFYIRLGASFTGKYISVKFNESGAKRTNYQAITDGSFGFNASLLNTWQLVAIPLSSFVFTDVNFNEVYFVMSGAGGAFQVDNIQLQSGGITIASGVNSVNGMSGDVIAAFADSANINGDSTLYRFYNKYTNTLLFSLPTGIEKTYGAGGITLYKRNDSTFIDGSGISGGTLQNAFDKSVVAGDNPIIINGRGGDLAIDSAAYFGVSDGSNNFFENQATGFNIVQSDGVRSAVVNINKNKGTISISSYNNIGGKGVSITMDSVIRLYGIDTLSSPPTYIAAFDGDTLKKVAYPSGGSGTDTSYLTNGDSILNIRNTDGDIQSYNFAGGAGGSGSTFNPDTLEAAIALKLNISDTAAMLLHYQNKINTNTDNIALNTAAIATKQATLVSGTNIKTVNGNSLLGSGDLTISGGGTSTYQIQTASGGTTFTFTSVPASYSDYIIFVNGCKIRSTTDYTTSGNVVTISTIISGDTVEYQRIK